MNTSLKTLLNNVQHLTGNKEAKGRVKFAPRPAS